MAKMRLRGIVCNIFDGHFENILHANKKENDALTAVNNFSKYVETKIHNTNKNTYVKTKY